MTTTNGRADWQAAVAVQDVPLATLSDDEYAALWAPERLELEPDAGPRLAPGLRGLLAREYAQLQPDGSIDLVGETALIRESRTANLGTVVIRLVDEDRDWLVVQPGVVLEQRRPVPGGFTFVLRDTRRAVRELVAEVVPPGATEGEEWALGPEDPLDRWAQLQREHPRVTSIDVLRPVLDRDAWVAQRVVLLSDGSAPGWCAFTAYDLRTTVVPAKAATVRKLLGGLLDGAGLGEPPEALS